MKSSTVKINTNQLYDIIVNDEKSQFKKPYELTYLTYLYLDLCSYFLKKIIKKKKVKDSTLELINNIFTLLNSYCKINVKILSDNIKRIITNNLKDPLKSPVDNHYKSTFVPLNLKLELSNEKINDILKDIQNNMNNLNIQNYIFKLKMILEKYFVSDIVENIINNHDKFRVNLLVSELLDEINDYKKNGEFKKIIVNFIKQRDNYILFDIISDVFVKNGDSTYLSMITLNHVELLRERMQYMKPKSEISSLKLLLEGMTQKDRIEGFCQHFSLVYINYLIFKIKKREKITEIRENHLKSALQIVQAKSNYNCVDELAKQLQSIKDQSNGIFSGDRFVKEMNKLVSLKDNLIVLEAFINFKIDIIDVEALFAKVIDALKSQATFKPINEAPVQIECLSLDTNIKNGITQLNNIDSQMRQHPDNTLSDDSKHASSLTQQSQPPEQKPNISANILISPLPNSSAYVKYSIFVSTQVDRNSSGVNNSANQRCLV